MTWTALTNPSVIACRAALGEIDAMLAAHRRALAVARARHGFLVSDIARRRGTATVEGLTRKVENLERARELWLDDFKKTENPKETP
jgi:hypothetical protein